MIDADAINPMRCPRSISEMRKWIDDQPTAYDLDKVVEQLEGTFDNWGLDDGKKDIMRELVKGGLDGSRNDSTSR